MKDTLSQKNPETHEFGPFFYVYAVMTSRDVYGIHDQLISKCIHWDLLICRRYLTFSRSDFISPNEHQKQYFHEWRSHK